MTLDAEIRIFDSRVHGHCILIWMHPQTPASSHKLRSALIVRGLCRAWFSWHPGILARI